MAEADRIQKILNRNGIRTYLKTLDNFTGGGLANRRAAGSYGMDASFRFIYEIYVSGKEFEKARSILGGA